MEIITVEENSRNKTVETSFPNSTTSDFNSATYLTIPLVRPKVENDLTEVMKFRKFPIRARPSGPT